MRNISGLVLMLCSAPLCAAQSLDTLQRLSPSEFATLAEHLSAAFSYKPVIPAAPLGVFGFDLSGELAATRLRDKAVFAKAAAQWDALDEHIDTLNIARIHAHKGLPFDLDVGFSYGTAINSNANTWGAELRYAVLAGSAFTPAVAVRGAYSQMTGVGVMDLSSASLDISVSKGVLMFTPYAGLGYVWSEATPKERTVALERVDLAQAKAFCGLNMNFGIFNAALEYDNTGGYSTLSLKLGSRF